MEMDEDSIELIEHEVAWLLRRVEAARKGSGQMDQASYLLLGALASRGALSISALAGLFQLDISTLSRQTSALEANGWVKRVTSPEDGRVRALEITRSGRAQLRASRAVRYKLYTQLLDGWTEEERRAFGSYLARFNQAIRERRKLATPLEQEEEDAEGE
jgi:DNA-binding MarR family transcriptional regulator